VHSVTCVCSSCSSGTVSSGAFKLTYSGQTTARIAPDASSATIVSAFEVKGRFARRNFLVFFAHFLRADCLNSLERRFLPLMVAGYLLVFLPVRLPVALAAASS
jgi:hypothetical protein